MDKVYVVYLADDMLCKGDVEGVYCNEESARIAVASWEDLDMISWYHEAIVEKLN